MADLKVGAKKWPKKKVAEKKVAEKSGRIKWPNKCGRKMWPIFVDYLIKFRPPAIFFSYPSFTSINIVDHYGSCFLEDDDIVWYQHEYNNCSKHHLLESS